MISFFLFVLCLTDSEGATIVVLFFLDRMLRMCRLFFACFGVVVFPMRQCPVSGIVLAC